MKLDSNNRSQIYKKIVFELLGNKCAICNNKNRRLHIHHKNKLYTDNNIKNLLLVCYLCHANLHDTELFIFKRIDTKTSRKYLYNLLKDLKIFLDRDRYSLLKRMIKDRNTKEINNIHLLTCKGSITKYKQEVK
jgi:hypothetical protein